MSKPHRCDVPGCGNSRRRWMRICETCFSALPRDIRSGIIDNYRIGKRTEWKRFCRLAAAQLNRPPAMLTVSPPCQSWSRPAPTPEQAFERNQRLLGERD